MTTKPQPIEVICADGVRLAALLFEPENPRAAVMMSGGTGFKKEFYIPFSQFLAENGFAVVSYDYRGTCGSAPADMSNCTYDYWEYGTQDMPAVLDYLDDRFPHLNKYIFGHSVGGQKVGLMPNFHKVKGLVTFATGAGYLAHMRMPYRLKAWYFFKIFTPLSIFFTGYVKAKSFNIMENLPRTVVRQWAAWCDVPEYFFNKKFFGTMIPKGHFHELTYPIHVFWASDDPLATWDNIENFWRYVHSSKTIDFQELKPSDAGNQTIDHFGFFKKQFRETLWQIGLKKLNQMVELG